MNELMEGSLDDMLDAYFVKGYGRETELEADRVGLEILAHAGYDPRAFGTLLGRLEKAQATGSGGFYATHPKAGDRIKALEKAYQETSAGGYPGSGLGAQLSTIARRQIRLGTTCASSMAPWRTHPGVGAQR